MVESWDGTLSAAKFYVAARVFAEQWRKFNSSLPQWSWVPSAERPWTSHHDHPVGYLSLENVSLPRLCEKACEKGSYLVKEECVSECKDEVIDAAVVVHNGGPEVHRYDLHAVYSASYRVPVLYFRAYYQDGQPLHMDEIGKDLPDNSAQLLAQSKWTFLTQEEHPELNRPWYMLHPCATSEWMKLLLMSEVGRGTTHFYKYIISWFSVVGQVFGFKLPSEMMNLEDSDCLH